MFSHVVILLKQVLPASILISIKRVVHRDWLTIFSHLPARLVGTTALTLHFTPEDPRSNGRPYAVVRMADFLNYRINPKLPAPKQVYFHWDDQTKIAPLCGKSENFINSKCLDISKKRVDLIFDKVFGYSITVDPLNFHGQCVEKSDENGRHDGRLVDCPLTEARPDCVYQKFIDSTVAPGIVDQLRVPIFRKDIPFVFIKYKKADNPFACSMSGSWKEVGDCFNETEVAGIHRFCDEIGLEYGELDILRDRGDQRIYIVDANKTPTLHFNGYPRKVARELTRRMANSFHESFIKI